jgi:HlyD family secretion protein
MQEDTQQRQKSESKVYDLPLTDADKFDRDAENIINATQIERYELPIGIARCCAYGFIAVFLLFILWSSLAKIDVVARAAGQLRPYGSPKLVESELSGKIVKIDVHEGSIVKQNDPLVELDAASYKNDLDQRVLAAKQEKIKLAQIQQGRDALMAILKTPNVLPAAASDLGDLSQVVTDVYTTQQALTQARYDAAAGGRSSDRAPGDMSSLIGMKAQLESEQTQKQQQLTLLRSEHQKEEVEKKATIASLKQQVESQKQLLAEAKQSLHTSRQQLQDYETALDIGVSQVQYLDVKQKVGESERQMIDDKNALTNLQNQLDIANLELPRWKLQSQSETLTLESEINSTVGSLGDIQIKMRGSTKDLEDAITKANAAIQHARAALTDQTSQMAQQLAVVHQTERAEDDARLIVEKATITAPMSGTTTGIVVRAAGEVVTAGEELMKILPSQSDMIVEANVSDADIGFMSPGQKVKLKLDAFPYQDFGVIDGTVTEIEQYPEADRTKGYVYLVRIRPNQMYINARGKQIQLKEGLTCECDIILRKMSVLQVLMRPLARYGYLNVKS